ncbi:DUF6503 family protein [Wocania ichthyoenteri]|uniref:DUF6503 family protein n=1 Tax=Wocania ichthyoenteri TaxID=1230531 RepID=UPI00053EB587|nr:DUF6503 family protein [Wocania ichthyoenteri]
MKNLFLVLLIISLVSCKQTSETKKENTQPEDASAILKTYPENISKIFKAHGGIDLWNTMESLVFEIEHPEGNEETTTALKSRKSLIETDKFKIGFDGEKVWLKQDTLAYKGNAKFYYNLMFYFYAMPFVLADDGIVYEDVEPLIFEDKTYPGIKISYNAGVGESPEDEYVLYYDFETNKMVWLGYTVTFFSKEKSKEFHFIKYSNWQTVEGVLLPETLTWYNYENNKPTTKRNDLKFVGVKLSKEKPSDALFEMADGAKIVE